MFQYERDAQRVYEAVIKRMELFGLELSKEKTRIGTTSRKRTHKIDKF